MATPSAIAKRTEKRQIEILEAVQTVLIEVVGLRAEIAGLKERMTPAMKMPATRTKK